MKLPILFLTMSFLSAELMAQSKPAPAINQKEIEIQYQGGIKDFRNPKISMNPFQKILSFTSEEKETYKMDCLEAKTADHWVCNIPCEGGSLKIRFANESSFSAITIEPFQIRLRKCDGTESAEDPTVVSKSALNLKRVR